MYHHGRYIKCPTKMPTYQRHQILSLRFMIYVPFNGFALVIRKVFCLHYTYRNAEECILEEHDVTWVAVAIQIRDDAPLCTAFVKIVSTYVYLDVLILCRRLICKFWDTYIFCETSSNCTCVPRPGFYLFKFRYVCGITIFLLKKNK